MIENPAQAVLHFWFEELAPEQQFKGGAAVDAMIADRFGALIGQLRDTDAAGWRETPDAMLAAIIVLDQFSRNVHRGTPDAFATDPLALSLTLDGIERGLHRALEPARRAFFYMPLMHAEDRGVARFALIRFADPELEHNLAFARDHAAVIDQFGRYPQRNAALGRASTPAEAEWLAGPHPQW